MEVGRDDGQSFSMSELPSSHLSLPESRFAPLVAASGDDENDGGTMLLSSEDGLDELSRKFLLSVQILMC